MNPPVLLPPRKAKANLGVLRDESGRPIRVTFDPRAKEIVFRTHYQRRTIRLSLRAAMDAAAGQLALPLVT